MKDIAQDGIAQAAAAASKTHPPLLKTGLQDKSELERLCPKGATVASSNAKPMNSLDRMASIPDAPSHALHKLDNWDGEGDTVFLFAFERDGVFHSFENGKPVLEYQGDKVLQAWPLT